MQQEVVQGQFEENARPETSKCSRQARGMNRTMTNFRSDQQDKSQQNNRQDSDQIMSQQFKMQLSGQGFYQGSNNLTNTLHSNNNNTNNHPSNNNKQSSQQQFLQGITLDQYFQVNPKQPILPQQYMFNSEFEQPKQQNSNELQHYRTSTSRNSNIDSQQDYQEYLEDAFEIHETDEEYSESNCESRIDLENSQKISVSNPNPKNTQPIRGNYQQQQAQQQSSKNFSRSNNTRDIENMKSSGSGFYQKPEEKNFKKRGTEDYSTNNITSSQQSRDNNVIQNKIREKYSIKSKQKSFNNTSSLGQHNKNLLGYQQQQQQQDENYQQPPPTQKKIPSNTSQGWSSNLQKMNQNLNYDLDSSPQINPMYPNSNHQPQAQHHQQQPAIMYQQQNQPMKPLNNQINIRKINKSQSPPNKKHINPLLNHQRNFSKDVMQQQSNSSHQYQFQAQQQFINQFSSHQQQQLQQQQQQPPHQQQSQQSVGKNNNIKNIPGNSRFREAYEEYAPQSQAQNYEKNIENHIAFRNSFYSKNYLKNDSNLTNINSAHSGIFGPLNNVPQNSDQAGNANQSRNRLTMNDFYKRNNHHHDTPDMQNMVQDLYTDNLMRKTAKENKFLKQKELINELIQKEQIEYVNKYASHFNLNQEEYKSLVNKSHNGGNFNDTGTSFHKKKQHRLNTPNKAFKPEYSQVNKRQISQNQIHVN